MSRSAVFLERDGVILRHHPGWTPSGEIPPWLLPASRLMEKCPTAKSARKLTVTEWEALTDDPALQDAVQNHTGQVAARLGFLPKGLPKWWRDQPIRCKFHAAVVNLMGCAVQFLPRAIAALAHLSRSQYAICIVSDQEAAVQQGFGPEAVNVLHRYVLMWLAMCGVRVDVSYLWATPHDRDSEYRKPKPGLLLVAQQALDLDLMSSWVIEEYPPNAEMAIEVGARAIIVETGRGRGAVSTSGRTVVPDLWGAVDHIENEGAIE